MCGMKTIGYMGLTFCSMLPRRTLTGGLDSASGPASLNEVLHLSCVHVV